MDIRALKRLREGDVRIPGGCAIAGIINKQGRRFGPGPITAAISQMRERSNGLGGGFATYGIYPEFKDMYALHVLYEDEDKRSQVEELIKLKCATVVSEPVPTRKTRLIKEPPGVWRYFCTPRLTSGPAEFEDGEFHADNVEQAMDEVIFRLVMHINSEITGAYVISSGKNMGVFKGQAYPEDIAEFFRLDDYRGYMWTAHGRFPTNTPGWWGGAHPFGLLEWSVVHNGEISSYGANRRYLEMFDYEFTLQTDTEIIAYAVDYLCRKQGLPLELAAVVFAPPLWEEIDRASQPERSVYELLRFTYGSLLLNGPFSIVVGFRNGMMALNDRIKLRPLAVADDGDMFYVASEEAAIRAVCPHPEQIWYPGGGTPVIVRIDEKAQQVRGEVA